MPAFPLRRTGFLPLGLLCACNPAPKETGGSLDGAPAACGGPIYVAQAGTDADVPVLADPHAATFGEAPDPYQLHLSWADEPATSMAFVWRTDVDTLATQVQFGPDASYGNTVEGGSFYLGSYAGWGRVHEVHLCGLSPSTTYHYRVGGEGHWSDDHTFTTAPPKGQAGHVRFLVAGDSRDDQATFGLVLQAAAVFAPDFYIFSGDAVDVGTNVDEWNAWFDSAAGYLEDRPLLVVHGNHEFQAQTYFALVAQPGNEQWFSLDYGDLHFVVLNDTVAHDGDRKLQAGWMAADLGATDARWRFAVHHMPAYSSCTSHGSDEDLRYHWSPVEEQGGVAVDFSGHNHNYERSFPIRDGELVKAEEGTTYVVSAGAGATLSENDRSNAFTEVAAMSDNFVIVDVDGRTLTLTAYDLAGNVLDTFTTTR